MTHESRIRHCHLLTLLAKGSLDWVVSTAMDLTSEEFLLIICLTNQPESMYTSVNISNLQCPLQCRSNSAHDLGETIDPELLPDLETLQESTFEIPTQLRLDLPQTGPAQRPNSHSQQLPYNHHQAHEQHQHSSIDQSNRSQSGHTQPLSGATTPSAPRSTASDDSLQRGCQYSHNNLPQQQDVLQLSPGGPVRLAQSKSMPILDEFDELTELQQQAADMLADVSSARLSSLMFGMAQSF